MIEELEVAFKKCAKKEFDGAFLILEKYEDENLIAALSEKEKATLFFEIARTYKYKTAPNVLKTKLFYKKSASLGNVNALINCTLLDDLDDDDNSFFKERFKELYTDNRSSSFYAEYGRILKILKNKGDDIDILEIKNLYEKSIEKNPDNSAPYLYIARIYRDYKDKPPLDGNIANIENAEKYFDLALKKGSTYAAKELYNLRKSSAPEISFDLMNSSQNLDKFIENLTTPSPANNFSLILSGPIGAGQDILAVSIMKSLLCEYEIFSAKDLLPNTTFKYMKKGDSKPNSYYIDELIEVLLKERKGIILKNIDILFPKDQKNLAFEHSKFALMEMIKDNVLPVILIVEDINNIDQRLKNAFTFRIQFSYMDSSQKEAAYKLFFNYDAPLYLRRLGGLVLDDFSRVKKQAKILDIAEKPEAILNLLEEEAKFKAGGATNYLKPDTIFDFSLVNADLNLPDLIDKLKLLESKSFSMIIYGPPGTGKSYFLRHLADEIGLNTVEYTASDLLDMYSANSISNIAKMFKEASDKKSMIIIDEIKMLIKNRENSPDHDNKVVNAFLTGIENFKYPFACTTNFFEKIDPAILRRFIFKTKFDYLTKEQNFLAFKYFFKFEATDELSQVGGLTNGDYSTVKKKAIILDKMNDADALFSMLKEESLRKTKSLVSNDTVIKDFDKGFINTDINMLDGFVKNIKRENKNNFSLLLYGPSGTGKSLYLRYVASTLGYEIIERRASDIIGRFHGDTVRNIATAFREAKDRKAFLIFDEIDGVLWNKDKLGGTNIIFTDQINEFLVQMENHPYPFAGTTNYLENVEPAALRRFTLNALFDFLKPEQYEYVYERTFNFKPFEDISYLNRLTPALFKNAYKKAELSEVLDNEQKVFEIFLNEAKTAGNKQKEKSENKTYATLEIVKKPLYEKPISAMYNEVLKGFVKIWNEQKTAHGSGFFITKDGFILTNKHVVSDNKFMTIELFSGREVAGEVLRSNDLDVALIKISDENLCVPMPLRLAEPNPGTTVFSMGNPDNKDQVLSKGAITRYTENTKGFRRIESDSFSYGGVSGGPLMDECGNVLGLNVEGWMDKSTNYKTKLGLAMQVPILDALEVLNIKIK